jgi:hypothetical protein
MPTAIIHIQNEDPVLGDLETMPAPTDLVVIVKNPRKRDGKDLHYLDPRVTLVVFPMARVNFIEILPSGDEEEIITFVRE